MPKTKPLISVVDDDESMREAVRGLMKSLGYTSEAFASAEEFLGSRQLPRTSCVIADVQMPGMTGLELHRHLVASGKDHSNHSDHGLPRRQRAGARVGGWGHRLPEQTIRRERPARLYPLITKHLTGREGVFMTTAGLHEGAAPNHGVLSECPGTVT